MSLNSLPHQGNPDQETKNCRNCGANEVIDGKCPYCGTQYESEGTISQVFDKKRGKIQAVLFGSAILFGAKLGINKVSKNGENELYSRVEIGGELSGVDNSGEIIVNGDISGVNHNVNMMIDGAVSGVGHSIEVMIAGEISGTGNSVQRGYQIKISGINNKVNQYISKEEAISILEEIGLSESQINTILK